MSRWRAFASGIALVAAPVDAASAPWPSAAVVEPKVDQFFKEYDRRDGPGCAVGVYNAGRILFAKGYGLADLDARRPITPESVFSIASMSKQFTAFAIALLERDGKVSLDAPVRRYVPELPEFEAPITVRHLIHHTSGLRDFGSLMEFTGWKLDQELSKQQLFDLLGRQRELNFAPGTKHEYGNTNYVLLALIVEGASGRSFRDLLAERLFTPLGMASSDFKGETASATNKIARNYAPSASGFVVNHVWGRAYAPGGVGVHSSLEDLARWDANYFTPVVGDPTLIEKLYAPGRLVSGDTAGYAYGLQVGAHRGRKTISHSGLGGGSFFLVRFPEERLSVATLCNQYGVGAKAPDTYTLSFKVADLFLPDAEASEPKRQQAPAAVPLSKAELNAYAGVYWVEDEGTPISIQMTAAGLAEIYDGKPYEMIPTGPGQFQEKDGPVAYSFSGPDRDVLTLKQVETGFTQRARRRAAWIPSAADLRQLAGRYCSSEVDVCWSIERRGTEAWLVRPGFLPMLLKPAFADTFQLVDNHWIGSRNVRVTLERRPKSEISSFRVSRGRVRNLLFERRP